MTGPDCARTQTIMKVAKYCDARFKMKTGG